MKSLRRLFQFVVPYRWQALVAAPRPRYVSSATFVSSVLDGKLPDTVWHRLFLDARIPPGARVAVESRAADSEAMLAQARWDAEPALYRRHKGSEIPFDQPFTESEASRDGTGTWETLLQRDWNGVLRQLSDCSCCWEGMAGLCGQSRG